MAEKTEIRFEVEHSAVAVLDGYCSATGRGRTDVMKMLLKDWSDKKLHEATLIMRVAGGNPTLPADARHLMESMK
jgi:hypothetical protein